MKKQKESEDIVKRQNEKRLEHQKNQNDRCLASDDIPVGSLVFIKNRKRIDKLDKRYIGPFIVTENKLKGAYDMKSVETGVTHAINRKDFVVWEKTKNLDEVGSVLESKSGLNMGRVLPLVTLEEPIIRLKTSDHS